MQALPYTLSLPHVLLVLQPSTEHPAFLPSLPPVTWFNETYFHGVISEAAFSCGTDGMASSAAVDGFGALLKLSGHGWKFWVVDSFFSPEGLEAVALAR